MNTTTINIIICGIVAFGLVGMFLNQIELASVALGGIVGFLSKQNVTIEAEPKIIKVEPTIMDDFNESEC